MSMRCPRCGVGLNVVAAEEAEKWRTFSRKNEERAKKHVLEITRLSIRVQELTSELDNEGSSA